jgi:hypothetical protein
MFHVTDDPCRSQDILFMLVCCSPLREFLPNRSLLRRFWSSEGSFLHVDGMDENVIDHPDCTVTAGDTTD